MDLAKIRKKARASASSPEQPAEEGAPAPEAPPQVEKARRPPRRPAAREPLESSPPPADEVRAAEPPPPHEEGAQAEFQEHGVGQAEARQGTAGEKLLIFDLESEKYAIPIHDIAQIIETPPTTPIPNSPDFLHGILSLRGKIVSIIDVSARLGLKRAAGTRLGKIVVLDLGADQFGLLVDDIDQVVEVDLSALEPPPEGFRPMAQDFVEGVFHHRRKAVAFLNLPMFLAFEI